MDSLTKIWVNDPASIVKLILIAIGTLLAIVTIRRNTNSTKVSNLLAITQGHRDIWSKAMDDPDISKILNTEFDISSITPKQKMFINFIIMHFSASFEAEKKGALIEVEQLKLDARNFFNLPAPNHVWNNNQKFQNKRFRKFVNKCINSSNQNQQPDELSVKLDRVLDRLRSEFWT